LIILIIVGLKVPMLSRIPGPSILYPGAVWTLSREGNGPVRSGWLNNQVGGGGEEKLYAFTRSDLVRLELDPAVVEGARISAGDTIATFRSLAITSEIELLQAEANQARAGLSALEAGARTADIEVARSELASAETELESYRAEYDRVKQLYESKVTPLERWQAVEGEWKTRESAVQVARSTLAALSQGARPTDVAVARANVERLETAINAVRQRESNTSVIVSAVSGVVRIGSAPGEIVRVERVDTLVAMMPVPQALVGFVPENAPVVVSAPAGGRTNGAFKRFIAATPPAGGLLAVCLAPNPNGMLLPGMRCRTEIKGRPRSLFSALGQFWTGVAITH
jgi:hypothetical protein